MPKLCGATFHIPDTGMFNGIANHTVTTHLLVHPKDILLISSRGFVAWPEKRASPGEMSTAG